MLDAQEDFLLIDCRTPQEYQLVRLDQAWLVPLQEVADRLDELEQHADRKAVVYCHHGGRSLQMAMLLRQRGFGDIKSMAGGIDLWAIDIDPALRRY